MRVLNNKNWKPKTTTSWNRRPPTKPKLRFSPYAWAKLHFLRDIGDTEVGCFGISAADDLLLVEDVVMVEQTCSAAFVSFDDDSVADFFDDQIDQGRHPEQVGRIWIHTHPASSAHPSGTDESTFEDAFGKADWSIMFILAKEGATYCRLQTKSPVRMGTRLKSVVDWEVEFPAADQDEWLREYEANVLADIYGGYGWNWGGNWNSQGSQAAGFLDDPVDAETAAFDKAAEAQQIERWNDMQDYLNSWGG